MSHREPLFTRRPFARSLLALPAVFAILLTGCTGTPLEPESELEEVMVSPEIEVQEEPEASDYIESQLQVFEVDEEGSFLIDGYLVVEYQLKNVSDQVIGAIATTLTVETKTGELLYSRNLNRELELLPGVEIAYGIYGDFRAPLIRRVPQWAALLDMEDPAMDAIVKLEIRKLMLEDDGIVVFREDIPEGIQIDTEE